MLNLKTLKNLDRDELLSLVGLETRRTPVDWIIPALGLFGVGMLVGAGVGMLMAPKSGRELMDDLRTRLQGQNEALSSGMYTSPSTSSNASSERSGRTM